LRILHLGKYFPPHPGGIERHLADLLCAQRADGLEAHALVHGSAATRSGLPDYVTRVPCMGQIAFVPLSPLWPLALERAIRRLQPHLIHAHVPNASAFWLLASPAARRRRWLLHWHADIPQDSTHPALRQGYPLYREFEAALLRRAAAVVATSPSYVSASSVLGKSPTPVHVVPLGLPEAPPAAPAPTWPGPGLRLLAVGRFSYYKGFDVLLRALAQVQDCSLLLIGDGEQAASLQRQIRQFGLYDRVELCGGVDDAGVEAAYRACDLFCLPSVDRAEAFGLVLLEAMRAGKAVVSSAIPGSGVCDVVVDGETGLKVPPGDAAGLAAAIRRLQQEVVLRERLGSNGRLRFERHYSISASAAGIRSVYAQVLDTAPATAAP
jgi:glycosyltransferase involved in cell wall biosynthesis